MNKTAVGVLIVAIAAGAGGWFFLLPHDKQNAEVPPQQASRQTPAADNEPLTRFPVPSPGTAENKPEEPLPTLQESDPALLEALGGLFDPNRLGELFFVKDMINRFVVTVDNLPRAKLPLRLFPAPPAPGKFRVIEKGVGEAEINPDNYRRYARYVAFFEDMDSRKIAAVYFHFYPLIQQAYRDLGYKSAYFNDRLIVAIDDLLAAPKVTDPVPLLQPSVFYKYADPRLEALSSGQKILIRIGYDNAVKIKTKLRELREILTQRGANR